MSTETDKIEQDIEASRTRLNDTIEQLGGKLSPGQMLDEALGLAKGQAGELVGSLGKQVKDNPIPLLLIGAGIGMLALNMRKGEDRPQAHPASAPSLTHDEWSTEGRYRRLEGARAGLSRMAEETQEAFSHRLHDAEAMALELKQHAGEAIDAFKARVRSAADSLQHTAQGIRTKMDAGMHSAAAFASQTAHDVKAGMGDARHKAQALYDDYPLAAGAIGLAVGAIIGAAAPLSNVERDKLAGVADAAARAGADGAERAASAVQKAADKAAAALH
jgi:ElaB/YqjD/DUF883 family membrane-anchored ribosome-binding protein